MESIDTGLYNYALGLVVLVVVVGFFVGGDDAITGSHIKYSLWVSDVVVIMEIAELLWLTAPGDLYM